MNEFLEKVPQFWQGVLGSILAGILILIASKVFGLFSNEMKRSKNDKQKKFEEIRIKVLSEDSVLRVEGYFQVLFSVFQWLFVANILWVVSGILIVFNIYLYSILIFLSLFCFYLGLKEIFILYKILKKDTIFIKHSISSDKLEIHYAEYGFGDKYYDVTEKIISSIKDNKLEIIANNENFRDPIEGVGKQLTVVYSFGGNNHKRKIPEGQILSLP